MARTLIGCAWEGGCKKDRVPGGKFCAEHAVAAVVHVATQETRAPSLFDGAAPPQHDTPHTTSLAAQPARARTSDPTTSRDAAASVTRDTVTALQQMILRAFEAHGDMADVALLAYLERRHPAWTFTPSGVRSRRSELSKANMERLDALARDVWVEQYGGAPDVAATIRLDGFADDVQRQARARLLVEGVRAPLWDTGKRVKIGRGSHAVWGFAR